MLKGFTKGFKPLFIQRLALLIGICYLMNPLQQQIKTIFHTISHAIEVPNSVMGHNSNSVNDQLHGHYDHQIDEKQHDHSLIDIIDSVLTASNESNDSEESILIESKIDKHITTYQFELFESLTLNQLHNFWALKEKQKSGYFEHLKEPPQFFLS